MSSSEIGDNNVHLPELLADVFNISRSEARRVIDQGAVVIGGQPVSGYDMPRDEVDAVPIRMGHRIGMVQMKGQRQHDRDMSDLGAKDLRMVSDALEAARGVIELVRADRKPSDLNECEQEIRAAQKIVWAALGEET